WISSSAPSCAPVSSRSPSRVKRPSSTAVRRTLEDQNTNAVWRIGATSGWVLIVRMLWPCARPVKATTVGGRAGRENRVGRVAGASRCCSTSRRAKQRVQPHDRRAIGVELEQGVALAELRPAELRPALVESELRFRRHGLEAERPLDDLLVAEDQA